MTNEFEQYQLSVQLSVASEAHSTRSLSAQTWFHYLVVVSVQFGRRWKVALESIRLDPGYTQPVIDDFPNWDRSLEAISRAVVNQLTDRRHKQLLTQWSGAGLQYGNRDGDPTLFYKEHAVRLTHRAPLDNSPSVQVRTLTGAVIQEVLCTELDKPIDTMSNCYTVLLDNLKITLTTRGQVVNISEVTYGGMSGSRI